MKIGELLSGPNGRVRTSWVLLRRLKPKTQRIDGPFATEVVYEDWSSGLVISDPEREITRCEVVKAGDLSGYSPGETVIVRSSDRLSGFRWHEDGHDFLLTRDNENDVIFKYRSVQA